jgi:hypothetical protein
LSPACWRLLLLLACVLVFAFAMHAKVAVYHQSSQPQTSTSDKLWMNAPKMTGRPLVLGASLLWFATLVVWLFSPQTRVRFVVVDVIPGVFRAPQLYLRRFLRPPPAR